MFYCVIIHPCIIYLHLLVLVVRYVVHLLPALSQNTSITPAEKYQHYSY